MLEQPAVLAICVNWNGSEVLSDTLKSLQQSDYPDLRTVVVDSASTDGSSDLVPPSMKLIQMAENRGYAAALNAGMAHDPGPDGSDAERAAAPNYYLLLNNDVRFGPNMIRKLVAFAEQTGPGIWGPKVLLDGEPDTLDAAWGELTWSHVLCKYHGRFSKDRPQWNQTRQAPLILGCVMLIHRTVVRKVGPFDERFFMYHEEADYLYRTRRVGYPVYYCPFARAFHRSGHSTSTDPHRRVYWVRRNTVLFMKKHKAGAGRWAYLILTLLLGILFNLVTFRWRKLGAAARGAMDGFGRISHE